MIGRITGKLLEKDFNQVLIDTDGLAYEVDVPHTTYDRLGNVGDTVTLHTHLIVREDAQLLYGFFSRRDRAMFRALIRINKVGPKLAVAILSGLDADMLIQSITNNDVKSINAINGVGKVTAERIVLEMKDKVGEMEGGATSLAVAGKPSSSLADAESALVGLGFKPQEAAIALSQVENPEGDIESLIKQALRALS